MIYLYGDATESPLRRNVLEILRAVLVFGVNVIEGAEQIASLVSSPSHSFGKDEKKRVLRAKERRWTVGFDH